jgi:hypothetical protein
MPRLFEAAKAQRGSGMDSGKEEGGGSPAVV